MTTLRSKKEQLLAAYSNWFWMQNYSVSTYKAYMGTIRKYWKFCETRKNDPNFDKFNAVQTYLAYRMTVEKLDYSTVNGDYSALQWFYKYILGREWNVKKLIRPRKEKRLARYITPTHQQLNKSSKKCLVMIPIIVGIVAASIPRKELINLCLNSPK